jgi:hypothetical protein
MPSLLAAFSQPRMLKHKSRNVLEHPQALAGAVGVGIKDAPGWKHAG